MARTSAIESIVDATRSYEAWIARQAALVRADLDFKHEQMARAPFPFLRATFYRWVQQWTASCADLARAPKVLAVGDLHIENFGTWRDTEGRLIWGINDFDEGFPLAYTIDLVRLATSARLAIRAAALRLTPGAACTAILRGYRSGVESGGRPFVLAEEHQVLRGEAESELRNPVTFWSVLMGLRTVRRPPPKAVALLRAAIHDAERDRYVARRAGLGSLGHPRIVAIAEREGGHIAREAKALVGSGAAWAGNTATVPKLHYRAILEGAVRCADPFLEVRNRWVVRRLAPDCSRIEFTVARTPKDLTILLESMGAETANIHLGSGKRRIAAVRADLDKRGPEWLKTASSVMEAATLADHAAWRRSRLA
jgi:Uncharacterized protein conserved in bacteria (DUF2252)